MRIGPFGVWEILIILVVVLLIFGPRRLPEMAKGLGQSVRAFRKELRDMKADLDGDDERPASKPQQPSAATVPSQEPPSKADAKEGGNATS
jgi:sec-independent protein translocase protein TatA